jgi:preprotein translocase subunit SecG
MQSVLLAVHIVVTLALIGTVLLQRSEGGALGIGGGGGGGLMSGRAAGNVLTKTTIGLAAAFMLTSVLLAVLIGSRESISIIDQPAATAPAEAPASPAQSSTPSTPSAPIEQ